MMRWLDLMAGRLLALEPYLVLAALPLLLVSWSYSWLGLAAALLPWAGRLWLRQTRLALIPLDAAVALFLAGGFVGLWAAYDQAVALSRFYGIMGAVVFYCTVRTGCASASRRRATAILLVLGGLGLSAFFVAQYSEIPSSKFPAIAQARAWIAGRFPQIRVERPNPSTVASYLIMVLPLAVAMAAHPPVSSGLQSAPVAPRNESAPPLWERARLRLRRKVRILWGAAALIMTLALVLTESRGGWLAVGAVAALWYLGRWRYVSWAGVLALLTGGGLFVATILWGDGCGTSVPWLAAISGAVPLVEGSVNRLDLYRDMVALVRTYPFIGLGLGGMPLVYSVYYLMVGPHPFLYHAHNLFLQVWLEQGLLGAAAVIGMAAALGAGMLVRVRGRLSPVSAVPALPATARFDSITTGALWGCLAILIDGIWNAGLYPGRAVPLLLILPALAVGPRMSVAGARTRAPRRRLALAGGLVLAAVVAWWAGPSVRSGWLSGLGAVAQGRADLATARSSGEASLLREEARSDFSAALAIDENNATAHLRLGGMLLDQGAYLASVSALETAYRSEPCSAAALQLLATANLALGDTDKAYQLWRSLPNARQRLEIQIWRFYQAGDLESARAAELLLARLGQDVQ